MSKVGPQEYLSNISETNIPFKVNDDVDGLQDVLDEAIPRTEENKEDYFRDEQSESSLNLDTLISKPDSSSDLELSIDEDRFNKPLENPKEQMDERVLTSDEINKLRNIGKNAAKNASIEFKKYKALDQDSLKSSAVCICDQIIIKHYDNENRSYEY